MNKADRIVHIRKHLRHGDYLRVATATGFSREYVSKVLAAWSDKWNEAIVCYAEKLIESRKEKEEKQLKEDVA